MRTISRVLGGFLGLGVMFVAIFALVGHKKTEKQDLFTLRQIVSEYTLDHQKKPHSFDDLVEAGYLNSAPACLPEGNAEAFFADEPETRDSPLRIPFTLDPYDVLLPSG
jgi:hypothetical protein